MMAMGATTWPGSHLICFLIRHYPGGLQFSYILVIVMFGDRSFGPAPCHDKSIEERGWTTFGVGKWASHCAARAPVVKFLNEL
jgi:hypothetical protein